MTYMYSRFRLIYNDIASPNVNFPLLHCNRSNWKERCLPYCHKFSFTWCSSQPVTKSDLWLIGGMIPCIFLSNNSAGDGRFEETGYECSDKARLKSWFFIGHFFKMCLIVWVNHSTCPLAAWWKEDVVTVLMSRALQKALKFELTKLKPASLTILLEICIFGCAVHKQLESFCSNLQQKVLFEKEHIKTKCAMQMVVYHVVSDVPFNVFAALSGLVHIALPSVWCCWFEASLLSF